MVAPRRTYILEHTQDLFTGRPDEPYSGATRLVLTDSGGYPTSTRHLDGGAAFPLWLRGLTLRPPSWSGSVLHPHPWQGRPVRLGPHRPG
jgi:hypothetical protein